MPTVVVPVTDRSGSGNRPDLTLSAVPGLLPEDDRTATAIVLWLGAIDALRAAGHREAADDLTDELVRFVLVDPAQRTPSLEAAAAHIGCQFNHAHRWPDCYDEAYEPDAGEGGRAGDPDDGPYGDPAITEADMRAAWGDR